MDVVQRHVARQVDREAFRRDRDYIGRHLPQLRAITQAYFAPEVRGLDRLPADGPFLIVSNHSGGMLMPDAWVMAGALLDRFGIDRPLYGLMFDAAFAVPGFGGALRKFGAVPASSANAERALDLGAGLLVYPGGDWEVYRPWTERNRIELRGHTGFVRLALRRGVPVFPAVSHGSHESLVVVSRGDRFAPYLGFHRLRIKVFPLVLGFPFGLAPVYFPYVPLPTKIVVDVLEPLDWSRYGPEAAEDPAAVGACYEQATSAMQSALDRLAAEMPHPLLTRLTGRR